MENIDNIKYAGLKMTPQRRMIYKAMVELRHASIEDIETYLKDKEIEIATSTVYRILDSFCRANLISLIFHPETGKGYYDITVKEHHHIFTSGRVDDFEAPELSELVREYLKSKNIHREEIAKIQVQITTFP